MNISKHIFLLTFVATILVGCSSTPDKVLPQEKMAQLLADIHIGESMVEVDRTKFYNDSLKKTVKQSILVKHNVTPEELDSSFSWYGRNIEEYIAVYDRVIEILNDDLTDIGAGLQEKVNVTQEGDSTDIWQGLRHYAINNKSASQYITFAISKDQHSQNGDYYTWKIKLINNPSPIKWGIAADYSDGTTEYINATASNEGWNNIKLISDSTKTLNKVYGFIYATPSENQQLFIDSITLVRMRVDRNVYRQRSGQRLFEYGKNKKKDEDNKESEETKSKSDKPTEPIKITRPSSSESKKGTNSSIDSKPSQSNKNSSNGTNN